MPHTARQRGPLRTLTKNLKPLKAKSDKTCGLVFPTAGCKPKLDFLDHKFRATFATWSLWAGVDLRTVQLWLGHKDIES